MEVDEEKLKAIKEWLNPKRILKLRSFHGLVSFHKRFVKSFSIILVPLIECIKKGNEFKWSEAIERSFKLIKEKICLAPILALPNLSKTFEIECDTSAIGLGVVLMQERRLIAYLSEKLNGASMNYSIYVEEFYALIKALRTWKHYLYTEGVCDSYKS